MLITIYTSMYVHMTEGNNCIDFPVYRGQNLNEKPKQFVSQIPVILICNFKHEKQ